MNNCKDCRFWNINGDEYQNFHYYDDNFYNESNAEPYPGAPVFTAKKRCLKILHANLKCNGEREHTNHLAVMTDGSGYSASLFTEANFGCAMFETRADKEPE